MLPRPNDLYAIKPGGRSDVSVIDSCPDPMELQRYVSGGLSESESAEVERHVLVCPQCHEVARRLLETFDATSKATAAGVGEQVDTQFQGPQQWLNAAFFGDVLKTSSRLSPTATFPHPDCPPELPGNYIPVRRIGRGGMGDVWEALDSLLGRPVAIKLLSGNAPGAEATQRILTEAMALGRLGHPGIVHVHEVISELSYPAVVMELVRGPSLSVFIRGRVVPERDAARLLCYLCEAITHAHAHGVVHRDLKPSNVLLRPLRASVDGEPSAENLSDYQPVVSDFGIARLADDHTMTQTGQILGTPAYMPPEVANARPGKLTTAVDIYGLGAILYEVLAGRPPHQGENSAATLSLAQRGEITPPRLIRPGLSRDLENICLKCLSSTPSDRYPSVEQLRQDLCAFIENRPVTARSVGPALRLVRWGRRNPLPSFLLILLSVALATIASQFNSFVIFKGRQQRQISEQLDHAVELIDTLLGNFHVNSPAWHAVPPNQRYGIYEDAIRVYDDYIKFHCPDQIIPQPHLLIALRQAMLRQEMDPAADVGAELQRIELSLTALTPEKKSSPEVRHLSELCTLTSARFFSARGNSAAAAQQFLQRAEVLQQRGAAVATDSSMFPDEALGFLRSASGSLMSAANSFNTDHDFGAAAAAAEKGVRLLEQIIRAGRGNEYDVLNVLGLADLAAKNHISANSVRQAAHIADDSLRLYETYPIAAPDLKNIAAPILQSLSAMRQSDPPVTEPVP
jgi:serine/threonine protein kinase